MMSDIDTLFFELIRIALGTGNTLSRTPSQCEWDKIFALAQKQSLTGVCFYALQALGADADDGFLNIGMCEDQYLTWMAFAASIQERNRTVNKRCASLQKHLSEDGMRFYMMKGQSNAALYGQLAQLRQSGDIDVYVDGGFDKVFEYAKSLGRTSGVNELEMHVKVFKDTEVEIHYRPMILRDPIKNRRLLKYFSSVAEQQFSHSVLIDESRGYAITSPTSDFNMVHQLVHVFLHFFTGGVGLRQLMDYYFLLKSRTSSKEATQEPINVVSSLGLDRFASALMWVLQYVFAADPALLPWEPDEHDGRLLLKEIMISGNFGHTDERMADIATNKWTSMWFIHGKTFRFWRFDHWAWFWSPLWRLYYLIWRKRLKGFGL